MQTLIVLIEKGKKKCPKLPTNSPKMRFKIAGDFETSPKFRLTNEARSQN